MKEIAKIICRANKNHEDVTPADYDEIWDKLKETLTSEQYDLFLKLELCYFEMMEKKEINAVEYVLRLLSDEIFYNDL